MKIVIAGGSGQIGTFLARDFRSRGDSVVILSRSASSNNNVATMVPWDGETTGDWVTELDGADVLINLAGRSVNCRYTEQNRRAIIDSRVKSTAVLANAVQQCRVAPRIWLQSSTATIYAHRYDAPNDELTGIIAVGDEAPSSWKFSLDVAQRWENAFEAAQLPATRKVIMRSALVLSPDRGGVFDTLLFLVRLGLGGTAGSGKQYVSWIHDSDFIAAIRWVIQHESLDGTVNIASPFPLINSDFMKTLRRTWRTPVGLPATDWMLEIGAVLMQTETELILKSRRVVPARLLASGFEFKFPHWEQAAADLCQRWRENSTKP